tara:strand:+ start:1182 stop:1415 length:234 start_codon:yes stop_codon:yes gene_type:complete
MKEIAEKQMLEWQEELKLHKERLAQAQAVIEQETKLIAMIEGGIQFGDSLLKKNESSIQQSDTVELDQQSKTAPSKK